MNYRIVKIDLNGYPVQYTDDQIVGRLTEAFLRKQPPYPKLETIAYEAGLRCDYVISGDPWFVKLYGTLQAQRIKTDDNVRFAILFPQIDVEDQNEQVAVGVYSDLELSLSLVNIICEGIANAIDR
jgi:hypothetical protein